MLERVNYERVNGSLEINIQIPEFILEGVKKYLFPLLQIPKRSDLYKTIIEYTKALEVKIIKLYSVNSIISYDIEGQYFVYRVEPAKILRRVELDNFINSTKVR